MKIGERLKLLRTEANLTSVELAKLSGVSQGSISEIENDKRSPSIDILIKICDALNISIVEILPAELIFTRENSLTKSEIELIGLFKQLPVNTRSNLISFMKSIIDGS